MPRKSKSSTAVKSENARRKSAAWGGFLWCELSADQREGFTTWAADEGEKLISMIDHLCDAGYVISVRLDDENAAYQARLQTTLGEKPATWILSAYHESPTMALLLVCFKHFVIFDSDWSSATNSDDTKPTWG